MKPFSHSTEIILKKISLIENINFSELSVDEIKLILGDIMDGISFLYPAVEKSSILYRGVKYDVKPTFLSQLSYPPIDKARMGRANREGVQVFYCGSDKHVPFYELDAKVGDLLAISEWQVQKDLYFQALGFTESIFKGLESSRCEDSIVTTNTEREILSTEFKIVNNFLADSFCRKIPIGASEYFKLTNAIADLLMWEAESDIYFSGLVYPTIRMNANADNLAIRKEDIDNGNVLPVSVVYVEVLCMSEKEYTYKIIDVATKQKNGELLWNNLQKHWVTSTSEDLGFAYNDEGELCAYRSEFIEVDPFDFY